MTSNGIEKPRENPEPLQPLPRLKVLRDTWCSQDTVDRAADYLQQNNPDLIRELLLEEDGPRAPAFFNIVYEILDYLAEEGVELPAMPLGKMDLACELSRRLRKANGLFDVPPRGKPLAAGPDQPLPPLLKLAIDEDAARRGTLTQELTDRVLQIAYEKQPALWYALAEEYRNHMRLYATDEFPALLAQLMTTEYGDKKSVWTEGELYTEAVRRIYEMCGIKD